VKEGIRWLIRQSIRYSKPYRRIVIISSILIAASSIPSIPMAYATRDFVDSLIAYLRGEAISEFYLLNLVGIIVIATLLRQVLHMLGEGLHLKYQFVARKDYTLAIIRKTMNMPLKSARSITVGDYSQTLLNDIDAFGGLALGFMPGVIVGNIVPLLTQVYIMGTLSPHLLLISLSLTLLNMLLYRRYLPLIRDYEGKIREESSRSMNAALEALINLIVIKARGVMDCFLRRVEQHRRSITDLVVKRYFTNRKAGLIMALLGNFQPYLILIIGSYLAMYGFITFGTVIAFWLPVWRFYSGSMNFYYGTYMSMASWIPPVKRVVKFLEEEEERRGSKEISSFESLELRNVTFRYDHEDVLKNVYFSIRKGEKVAIVGRTGSGKSTLALIISGFLRATSGDVIINGINAEEYNLPNPKLAYVPQEAPIFSDMTLKDNIILGRNVDEKELLSAIEICELEELMDKLDAAVGRGGAGLSDGQKQRINLARAVLDKPYVIILDEALAAVDSKTESRIFRNLYRNLPETTFIVISHRLSTIMYSDRIVVIEGGRIVGQGTHEELMKTNKTYKELVEKQVITEK